jgi:hypothetical protein
MTFRSRVTFLQKLFSVEILASRVREVLDKPSPPARG